MNLNKNKNLSKICVMGLGYIGLPTASMLAIQGHNVIGVDIDEKKINLINNNEFTINEQGLNTLLSGAINSGNLVVKTKPEKCSTYIICVPTPAIPIDSNNTTNKGKTCDLSYVLSAIDSIKPYLKENDLIIIESTVSPKTTIKIYEQLINELNINLYMAYCPERVLPGNILKELVENDRIIGGINKKSAEKAKEIYETFVEGNIYLTDSTTAELVKLMENTFRDTNIALANEFAKISTELGINVWNAINLANKHPRVNILNPGPGVGGHCISIDPWFIVGSCENTDLIKQSRIINDNMPYYVGNLICEEFKALGIKNPKVGILGITYKGNVEDTRETPALPIIETLLNNNFKVSIYDPFAKDFKYPLSSYNEVLKNSDGLIFLTDHNQFKTYNKKDLKEISNLMNKSKIIIDTKNILNHKLWNEYGFNVKLLGNGENWLVKNLKI